FRLPGLQTVFVEQHFGVLTPHAPCLSADVLVNSLSEGRIERGLNQTGQLSAEFRAFHHTSHINKTSPDLASFYSSGSAIEKSPKTVSSTNLRKVSCWPREIRDEFHSGKVKRKLNFYDSALKFCRNFFPL